MIRQRFGSLSPVRTELWTGGVCPLQGEKICPKAISRDACPAGASPVCSERLKRGGQHPFTAQEPCASAMGKSLHRKFNHNMYSELSPHEVCTLDLIFQNSSLFEWWRPCLKNLRNVISLVSFLVLALRLEREKSGSSSHHLKSPFSMTLAGKNRTEQKAFKLMNAIFCSRWFFNRGKSTWYNRTPKSEQLQLTRVVILHHFSVL